MDTSHDLPAPGAEEQAKCAALVDKVMVQNDHVFLVQEIETARELRQFQWPPNITDFLAVIADIAHPGAQEVYEAWMALVYAPKSR